MKFVDAGGAIKNIYVIRDKNNRVEDEIAEKDWRTLKKQWDKDGVLNQLDIDQGTNGKIEGTPNTFKKNYDGTALAGKQFTYTDIPAFENLNIPGLVGVDMYKTFRITATFPTEKITAVMRLYVEVTKVNGRWQKQDAKTDPTLPSTWQ